MTKRKDMIDLADVKTPAMKKPDVQAGFVRARAMRIAKATPKIFTWPECPWDRWSL